jgi:wyosine [tRNA(Phe)-imidazoG37] synthetase (radical SAM superfamily)
MVKNSYVYILLMFLIAQNTWALQPCINERTLPEIATVDQMLNDKEELNQAYVNKNDYYQWDSMLAVVNGKLKLYSVNPFSFFPETPEEFVEYLKMSMQCKWLFPIRADMDITNKCNNQCIMCFSRELRQKYQDEIPTDRAIRIMKDLRRRGVKSLRFTGGGDGPVHPDFNRLLKEASRLGFQTTVQTNGDILDEDMIDTLAHYANHVRISVNASNNDERVRIHRPQDNSNDFSKLYLHIKQLVERRKLYGRENSLLLGASTLILPQNYKSVYKFVELMKQAGMDWVTVRKTTSRKWYEDNPDKTKIAMDELRRAQDDFNSSLFKVAGPYSISSRPNDDFSRCYAGDLRHIILANSTLSLCCLSRDLYLDLDSEFYVIGKLGDEENPVSELIDKRKAFVADFREEAPRFCDVCIDSEINLFLFQSANLLKEDMNATFKRVVVKYHDGNTVRMCQNASNKNIIDLYVPRAIEDQMKYGNTITLDYPIINDTEFSGNHESYDAEAVSINTLALIAA